MEEASKSSLRRPLLPTTQTESSTEANLARRSVSHVDNATPEVSSDTSATPTRNFESRRGLLMSAQKQVRSSASKGITLAQQQASAAMKGIQEMGEVMKNSMFKKEKRSHKFLLAPMTAITYQEYICCGCCKNGKQIRLDDKIEDIVRAEATIAEAMEHLVPIVEKGRPTRMEESVCCQCCCEKNANPGYDFLFNRQKFRSLLIIQLTMFFMAIILLNHENYMLKAPTCSPVLLDNFQRRGVNETTFNLNYVNSSVLLHSPGKIFIVPQKRESCSPAVKAVDAFGVCTFAEYHMEYEINFYADNPRSAIYVVSLLGYIYSLQSLYMGRKLFYDYKSGKKSLLRRCFTCLFGLIWGIFYVLNYIAVVIYLYTATSNCHQGLNNNDCFLRNRTIVSTKKEATSFYQGYQYLFHQEHETIKAKAAKSSNESLEYTKEVLNSLKPIMGLMEENFDTCQGFQKNGDVAIVFGIWLVFNILFNISNVSILISMIEYLKPGFTILAKRKVGQFKDGAFKKCPSLRKASNVQGKKLYFQFPPIVIAAVLLTVAGLAGIFAQYWSWQNDKISEPFERCLVPALKSVHGIAKDPKVTNSSQFLQQLLEPCPPYINYVDIENELLGRKTSFFRKFSELAKNLPAVEKAEIDELRASAVRSANEDELSPDMFAQIFGASLDAGIADLIVKYIQSHVLKIVDNNFSQLKTLLANVIIGEIIVGSVIAEASMVWARLAKIILLLCLGLRAWSIYRMLNKMYVIGVRQCEVVERCFRHEEGVYDFPMDSRDLDALRGHEPKSKIITNRWEILGAEVQMPHCEVGTLSEEEKRESHEKRLEYRHVQDVNYFLPGFLVSQLLGSIVQFWLLFIGITVLYILGFGMVVYKIVGKPANAGGGARTFNTKEDWQEGLNALRIWVIAIFTSVAIPFFVKTIVLRQFGKYFTDRKNGIKAPKRFILINFLQMVSCWSFFLYGQVLRKTFLELTKLLCFSFSVSQIYLIPVTFFVMIARIAGVLFRSLYLLGDLDKPFGYFDTLTYGWNSIIESMRIRAEFRKRAYHKAKEIRGKNVKVKDNEVLLGEKRYKNSWVMMTPSLAKGSHKEVKKMVASVI